MAATLKSKGQLKRRHHAKKEQIQKTRTQIKRKTTHTDGNGTKVEKHTKYNGYIFHKVEVMLHTA